MEQNTDKTYYVTSAPLLVDTAAAWPAANALDKPFAFFLSPTDKFTRNAEPTIKRF